MKRIVAFALALLLLLGLAGCQKGAAPVPTEPTETISPTEPNLPAGPQFDTPEQAAVVATALAFLDRGKYIQYDDTRLSSAPNLVVYRWEVDLKSPEDYTSQFTGYTNCAAFTHDVYLAALDYDIGAHTTAMLTAKGTSQRRYTYIPTGEETAEEKAAVEADFRANLQIGDIIVVRYNGSNEGNGHAMLYVGEEVLESGDIIHSTGSSYSYKDFTEKIESNGTVRTMSTKSLFSPGSSMYVFSRIKSLCLIRPLNTYKGGVPEHTQNRIDNLQGIVAQKLSSHTRGMTVNPGEEMNFTFSVTNKNDHPVTIEVRDTVPANTAYISGAEQVDGNSLSWQLTVPANETALASYKVQVNIDAACGEIIAGDQGTVGGVKTTCPNVYIQKTLTKEEQEKILSATEEITGKQGIALADAIYRQAVGKATGLPADFTALHDSYFQEFFDQHRLSGEGGMLDLIPTGMFGGRKVAHRTIASDYMRLEHCRTRLPRTGDLIAGDIILAIGGPNTPGNSTQSLYLFTGERMLNLNTGKTQPARPLLNMLLGYDRFVVIRPSIGM